MISRKQKAIFHRPPSMIRGTLSDSRVATDEYSPCLSDRRGGTQNPDRAETYPPCGGRRPSARLFPSIPSMLGAGQGEPRDISSYTLFKPLSSGLREESRCAGEASRYPPDGRTVDITSLIGLTIHYSPERLHRMGWVPFYGVSGQKMGSTSRTVTNTTSVKGIPTLR